MAATTTLLGLVTPTQGTLSGTWGDTVNYGISDYLDIAIAGTLSFTGDSPVTLANTTGSSSGNSIGSTTAQYACIRVTATTAATKVITGPSYSKTYLVDNASSFAITFKAAGQTGVSIAAGEKAIVFYNSAASNADYVKVASNLLTALSGTLAIANGGTGTTSTTFVNAATNVTGTLPVANGGTGLTSGTSGGILAYTASGTLASSAALTASALVIGGGAGAAPSTTTTATGALTFLGTPSSANLAALVTDETGSGSLVFGTTPTITTAALTNPTVTNYVESVVAIGNSGTTQTLSLTNGTVQTVTMTGNCTFTMPTATAGKSFILICTQDATGSRTATFTSVKFPGGTAPTLTTTASTGVDILTFVANGTSWFGTYAQAFA